jgi:outer membrane lipoprotein-sorting protein
MSKPQKKLHRTVGLKSWLAILGICLLACLGGSVFGEQPILGPKSTVDDVLDALQASGKDLRALTATVKTDEYNTIQGGDIVRTGTLAMKISPGGSAQVHLVYYTRQFGDRKPVAEKQEYVLDDGWGIKRDFTTKNQVRKQMAPAGQNVDVFQLGKSPIPMPIGQDKADVRSKFDVKIVPVDKDDPAGSIHLLLKPKPATPFAEQYKSIDLWVDPKLRMPVQVKTTDPQDTTEKNYDLTDLKINGSIPAGQFKLPPLDPKWTSSDEPL